MIPIVEDALNLHDVSIIHNHVTTYLISYDYHVTTYLISYDYCVTNYICFVS